MGTLNQIIDKPIISADSHVMEPPGTYIDRIAHKYRDTAPQVASAQAADRVITLSVSPDEDWKAAADALK